jgi:hypothetical protein
LEKGETSSLLVILECVGPDGSSTPAMTATAEPETGLDAASGSVVIPSLKPGQNAIVRIPSVTAGSDPTGMFRLRLNALDDQKRSRRIVLEGRIGFSRLTDGLFPKSQMFVNPAGGTLISGKPGASALIEAETLRARLITPSKGLVIVGAEFSPDGAHVAMTMMDPQQKQAVTVLTDPKLGGGQALPAGTDFLRWLGKDEVLLKSGGHLIRHPLAVGEDHVIDPPAGWAGPTFASNLIPGTDIQLLANSDGKVGIQEGAQAPREILQGIKVNRFAAAATDLSMFGAVDSESRFWVQHGLDAKPEVAASGVEAVLWGPISRRAVVVEAKNRSRVYDGRDRSWIDLGTIAGAEWSPDEERLLFVGDGYLSLLDDHRIEKLCDLRIIGQIRRIVISKGGDKAFLLAGIGGGLDVWTFALPSRVGAQKK